MVIIHGTGVVRAGQWSRKYDLLIHGDLKDEDCVEFRLIINEGLEIGSQMAYIRRARAAGYAVIVTNTNLNSYECPRFLRRQGARSIRVNPSIMSTNEDFLFQG